MSPIAVVGKVAAAPVTKFIVCSVAGAVASYFTQMAVGKVYDNMLPTEVVELESVNIETE